MQKTYFYTCNHCYKEYKPTKRGKQKFCSTSCRVANFNANKKFKRISTTINKTAEIVSQTKIDVPKVNLPDITNAGLGYTGALLLKSILTPNNKKAVTKQDLEDFKANYHGGRYRPVLNCPPNEIGERAYFDLEKNEVVFSFNKLA
jgi:hypothetical protein